MTRPCDRCPSTRRGRAWELAARSSQTLLLVFLVLSVPLIIDLRASDYLQPKIACLMILTLTLVVIGSVGVLPAAFSGRSLRLRLPPLFLPLLGLLAASALSMINARDPREALAGLGILTCGIALYLVITHSVCSERVWGILLGFLVGAGGLVAAYALLQYTGMVPSAPETEGADAMIATLGNVNYVAQFASFLIGPSLILVFSGCPVQRLLSLLCFALFVAVLVAARSWGAWLGAAAALAFFVFAWITPHRGRSRQNRGRRNPWFLIGLCAVGGLALLFSSAGGLHDLTEGDSWASSAVTSDVSAIAQVGDDPRSAVLPDEASTTAPSQALLLRFANWWVAWEMFIDHPVLGVGLGQYKVNFLIYKAHLLENPTFSDVFSFYVPRSAQAHNDPLQWVAETGLMGLAAMMWVLCSLVTRWRGIRSIPSHLRWRHVGVFGGILAVLTVSLVSFPLHRPAASLVLIVLVGLLDSEVLSEGVRPRQLRTLHLSKWSLRAIILITLAVSIATGLIVYRDYRSDLLLEAGVRSLDRGDTTSALRLFERSRSLAFQSAEALFYLGFTSLQIGDGQQAVAYLERSLRGRVTEDAYLFLAQAHARLGDSDRAWEVLDELLATEPHPSRKVLGYFLRAQLLRDAGDYAMAAAQLEHVISQGSALLRIQAHLLAAEIHEELDKSDLAEASYRLAVAEAMSALALRRESRDRLLSERTVPLAQLTDLDEEIAWLEDALHRARKGLSEFGGDADQSQDVTDRTSNLESSRGIQTKTTFASARESKRDSRSATMVLAEAECHLEVLV